MNQYASRASVFIGTRLFLMAAMTVAVHARAENLLPAFGDEGEDFSHDASDSHKISGWLPKDWVDNSEWAAVSAKYSKLPAADAPKQGVTALRIEVKDVSSGQLQLTSWAGKTNFSKGGKYAVQGWVRSKESIGIMVGARQQGDPYEFYAQEDLSTESKWQPFKFEFSFDEEKEAVIMFVVKETGIVDLAGVTCAKQ